MKFIKNNIFYFSFILVIFLVDRITKLLILRKSQNLDYLDIPISSFLNLNLVWNKGIAFGLFSFNQNIYYNSLTSIIILITLVLIWFMLKSERLEKISFSMIIGGSLGNIFDRIYYSSVVDFIDLHINNFHWFIFNIADIFISLGVIILIVLEFFGKKKV
tara:strand:- start:619 stop:1098 length:480 start_codon:yes stop_codon:yes gene_type:complete